MAKSETYRHNKQPEINLNKLYVVCESVVPSGTLNHACGIIQLLNVSRFNEQFLAPVEWLNTVITGWTL